MRRSILPAALLIRSLAPARAEEKIWSGTYETGFEVSAFLPGDAAGVRYWTSAAPGSDFDRLLRAEIDRLIAENGPINGVIAFHLEAAGTLSEVGRWGHLGAYPREFRIGKVRRLAPIIAKGERH